ncbi:MAG: AMP-binding protein, partial [Planctomycetes bacterium]|nr:AMP-binding protein [Planctomycetota bacterium]
MQPTSGQIESVLKETRLFAPPKAFSQQAHIQSMQEYDRLWQHAKDDPEGFWGQQAENLHWFHKWDRVLEWKEPFAKWFPGGKLNLSYNCLDRHLASWRKNKAAIVWEGEPGDSKVLRYQDLHREVCKFANVLKKLGVKTGNRISIYLPMIPELPIAMLACARIGAPHSVVFGGFSGDALADRNNDAQAKVLITADGGWRRGKVVPLKENADAAMQKSPSIEHCVVVRRTGTAINLKAGRDQWWHDLMADADADCPAEPLDSEHPLYILYTSGTTGKPKGCQHRTGGYLAYVTGTSRYYQDIHLEDVYWCMADIGWITGHSYIVYGPLALAATTVIYEGVPNCPDAGRP